MLFIQLVMTRTRDVACVDLTCICTSGVSMYIYIYMCVYSFQLVDGRHKRKRKKWFFFSSIKKNITRVQKKDLLLLVRLTSGLHDNDADDGIVVHIHIHFKRLLRHREEKQTTMTTTKTRSLFELIEFHGSILEKE
jgi:hypothetical protein